MAKNILTLNKAELWNLRAQIELLSAYTSDYENDMGIDPDDVCDFFDGYADYLGDLMDEDGIKDSYFFQFLPKYDSADSLWAWRLCAEEPEWQVIFDDGFILGCIDEEDARLNLAHAKRNLGQKHAYINLHSFGHDERIAA